MNDVRSAREALMAQLMADMDVLIARADAVVVSMNAAASRLDGAAQGFEAQAQRSAEAAKGSVGEFITKRTNERMSEASAQAKTELRAAMNDAARAAFNEIAGVPLQGLHGLMARIEVSQAKLAAAGRRDGFKLLHVVLVALVFAAIGAASAVWLLQK